MTLDWVAAEKSHCLVVHLELPAVAAEVDEAVCQEVVALVVRHVHLLPPLLLLLLLMQLTAALSSERAPMAHCRM